MLEELKIWGEIDIKKWVPRVCFSGINYTIKWLTETKFMQQVNT